MSFILKSGLYFFLLLSASMSVQAEKEPDAGQNKPEEKQYYIVEVVLFQHLNQQGKLDEFWHRPDIIDGEFSTSDSSNELNNNNSKNILTNDSPALAEYDLQNRRFIPLRNGIAETSPENYKLTDSAAHLRHSSAFKLLAHFGWTQRSLSKRQALPIRIKSNQFSDSLIPAGEIKLYVSRYLHMLVDLKASRCDIFNKEDKEDKMDIQNNQSELTESNQCINNIYQFKQNRKMRSKELHYIDNPVFGMLVYVTPFSSKQ